MNEHQSLVEVQRALPVELPSRFDAFLLKAHDAKDESAQVLETARDFAVDSEAAFQTADTIQAGLKLQSKEWNSERTGLTRPIDDFKQQFLDAEKGVTKNLDAAVAEYQRKMRLYLAEKEAESKRAQAEVERQLREQREAQEREAQKLEQKAAALKTDEAKQRALQRAEEIRTVAALTPTSIAPAAAPHATASNVGEPWEIEKIENLSAFLLWLAEHPEWHCVLPAFKAREMNRMASQFRDVVPVPGLKFRKTFAFRNKAK